MANYLDKTGVAKIFELIHGNYALSDHTHSEYLTGITNSSSTTNTAEALVASVTASGDTVTVKDFTGTVGNTTTPIYFKAGVPTALNYTIAKSVPANAVFTDTNTKVTQTVTTTNAAYPLLLAPKDQTATTTTTAYFDSDVTLNPSTNILNNAKVYEAYLQWGGTSLSGSISPIDVALDSQFSANRLSFMPAEDISVEYSTDSGSTWIDYGLTNLQKQSLVTTGLSQALYMGKKTTGQKPTDKLRVTITATNGKTCFSLKKILIYLSTQGATGTKVLIERSAIGSDTTYTQVGEYSVSGWSGWNSIPYTTKFGGSTSQTSQTRRIRMTFSFVECSASYIDKTAFQVSKISMHGETSWSNSGGSLASTGHLYSYDINKTATFPAALKADTIYEGGTALSAKYQAKGNYITTDTYYDKFKIYEKALDDADIRPLIFTYSPHENGSMDDTLSYNSGYYLNSTGLHAATLRATTIYEGTTTLSAKYQAKGDYITSGSNASLLRLQLTTSESINTLKSNYVPTAGTVYAYCENTFSKTGHTHSDYLSTSSGGTVSNKLKVIDSGAALFVGYNPTGTSAAAITLTNEEGSLYLIGGNINIGKTNSSYASIWNTFAEKSHTHSDYAASSHNHAASDITSGTFSSTRIPNLASSKITALTGYSIATSLANIATTDTLNGALGKLQYKLNNHTHAYLSTTDASGLSYATADFTDGTQLVTSYAADTGFDTTNYKRLYRRNASSMYNYIKGKLDSVYQAKGTAGATNSTSKLYLIGATSQTANSQTYSNSGCYISEDNLYSGLITASRGLTAWGNCDFANSVLKGISITDDGEHMGTYWVINSDGYAQFVDVYNTSDMRLKNVVSEDIPLSIKQIANAPTIEFKWKRRPNDPSKIGTSAQYWQGIVPATVSTYTEESGQDILTLDYTSLGVVSSIKVARHSLELEEKVKSLQEENDKLKSKLASLESRLTEIEEIIESIL